MTEPPRKDRIRVRDTCIGSDSVGAGLLGLRSNSLSTFVLSKWDRELLLYECWAWSVSFNKQILTGKKKVETAN